MGETCKFKRAGVFVLLGILLIILAIVADCIGLGRATGFGYKQILLLVFGAIILWRGIKFCKSHPSLIPVNRIGTSRIIP